MASDKMHLELDEDDVYTIMSCLNETMEALDDWEFATRVGVDRATVHALLRTLSGLVDLHQARDE
ncbi:MULTISPECIES: helix-turn-helix domain-containing protein [unclassified Frondihabitans]|uniref:helix-turn-helix domain-containing protein n=1 Tax=unclassified Frondihabitans TaxID=2626248 RepID=UPI000F501AD0|nr:MULTISPECIES: helix-turn-helix domain-containing protein [unclassified Frondihabitans]RPE76012.1 hypothetical protein EDF37_1830 [Frondihabitans sp. PhB153]RPF05711.1 hypothetical protein EDF39_2418 [Frondihabitans sp. PhB161]